MKILLLFSLFLFNITFAQYPKHANMARIQTDKLEGYPLFRECVNLLEAEGYSFHMVEEVSNALITEPVEISGLDFLFRIELEVRGGYARLHGFVLDDREFSTTGFYPKEKIWVDAAYRSNRFSTWRLGFNEVISITEKLRSHVGGSVQWLVEDNTIFDKEKNRL